MRYAMFLYRGQNWSTCIYIIDSIPHCYTENALKRSKNQEMWLCIYTKDKVGLSIIRSIPHCHNENVLKRSGVTVRVL